MADEQVTLRPTHTAHQTSPTEERRVGPPKWRSSRYALAYLLFLGLGCLSLQRTCFSLAIVCMVNHTALSTLRNPERNWTGLWAGSAWNDSYQFTNRTFQKHAYSVSDSGVDSTVTPGVDGPFVWDKETQGFLLGAMFWTFALIQIPAGYVFYYAGPRLIVGVSMAATSTFTLLIPVAAVWSPWAVFTLRAALGIGVSLCLPSMFAVWGKWAPTSERAFLISIVWSGANIANAVVFPTSALLCKYGFAGGWPSVFYVFGALGIVWSASWFLLVSDSPETHKRIDPAEREFIVANRASAHTRGDKVSVPWLKILTSLCFWGIAVAHFAYAWGQLLFLSNLPLFLYEVMKFDIKSNGVFSMLPYLALAVVILTSGFISDVIVRRQILGAFWTRRLFYAIAFVIPAAVLVAISFLDCTQAGAVVALLVIAVGTQGFALSVILSNFYDIAQRYAVSVQTVSTTIASSAGMITPIVVAELTKDRTREQWQIVFFITAGIFIAGTVVFCVFAQTTVQPWAATKLPQKDVDDEHVALNHLPVNGSETPKET
ncbi:hypothetical protein BaRGS_00013835 [Batillaria attramentaria]|uniref:Major facilitator superfamily (MFS) profile domain-containing protein n=1 Tax=Batillaria attramentaria TaxID=370345 RepID=A0ABD0L6P5_9CAEN